MKKHLRRPPIALRASVLAIHGALAFFSASAQAQSETVPAALDPAAAEMVLPTSMIDIGGLYVDDASAKFGEYNGLQTRGVHAAVDVDLRGGRAYKQDSGSVERWRAFGTRLGLSSRNVGAEYAQQGIWKISAEFDQLRQNGYEDFRTIWGGAGTATLTLPSTYPAVASRTSTTFTNIQGTTGAGGGPAVAIPAALQGARLETERRRLSIGGELTLSPRWTLSANARSERKEGTKLTGIAFGGLRGAYAPEPIDHETNIVEASARYAEPGLHFSLGYGGSFFRNHVQAWSAENPFFVNATLNNVAVLSSAPDNQSHQLNFDGGWRMVPQTKLSVSGAYTRMTQNDTFNYQPGVGQNVNWGATSANARQVQSNFTARLTHELNEKTDLSAGYRFEHRDTQTPIGTYSFVAADSPASSAVATRTFNNLPQNRKQQNLWADAQHTLDTGRVVTIGVEHERIRRSFDAPATPLVTQENPFLSGAANETTLRGSYRHEFNENLSGRLNLSHARRDAKDYYVFPPTSTTPVAVYPQVPSFRQFFLTDRTQDRLRTSADWQATPELGIQAGIEYHADRYPSQYGLRRASTGVFNLDGTYAFSEALSATAFTSYEDTQSKQQHYNLSGTALTYRPDPSCPLVPAAGTAGNMDDSCREWGVTQADRVLTFGIGVKSTQLMGGKLTLSGDVVRSQARTNVSLSGGTYGGAPLRYQAAENMPGITSTVTDLKLAAKFDIDKQSAVRVGVLHRRLKSSDPQFDLFGITSVQSYIGPGITSPQYRVNAVSVSYVRTFQ